MGNQEKKQPKVGLFPLITIVIGSTIGAGIFNLMKDMAMGAAPGAVMIAWLITGVGIGTLALCFQNLSNKLPDYDAGIFRYAEEGYGEFAGFASAWGYWLSIWLGNVAFATMLMSSLSYFFPIFEDGQNLPSILAASILLWVLNYLVTKGVENAAVINFVVTVCKLVPIFIFIVCAFLAFKANIFTMNFWGTLSHQFEFGDVMGQVKSTMLISIFSFVGIEGATILSARARRKKDVGRATVIGVTAVLIVYIFVTLLSFGVMSQAELAQLPKPGMAFVLEKIVGSWGAAFICGGLSISILGVWLSWTILPGETAMIAAKQGLFPKVFGALNQHGAPAKALFITSLSIQLFMFTFLISAQAYQFVTSLVASVVLVSYLFVTMYQIKYMKTQPKGRERTVQLWIGYLATAFQIFAVMSAGVKYILLLTLLFVPGVFVYIRARKEQGINKSIFNKIEWVAVIFIFTGAAVAVIGLISGIIQI
ncbi:arginine-ornithine antiporter [Isobaculum melis]|uniref:Arginine-ornithine antiporter n=1 Tax=Isobaculum melis TaxID=142588 RepID=A0A1H9SWG4_9LACT|nr:arginine-ornithine antiporter [Isobaculum melis]SER88713.1 amino acid/polyamine/organocation transporter, APC superfamily [Isobaculum melis]